MSHQQKMAEAIRRAYDRGLISKEIMEQLPSVEELAIGIVVVGGVLVGLGVAAGAVASTGVGALLEFAAAAIVLALAAIGIISSAKQVIEGIKVLVKFYTATGRAASYPELDAAGSDFAKGVAEVGVGTVMMILSYFGARQGLKIGKGALSKLPKPSLDAPPRPPEPSYEGKLRGETVKLRGVETKKITYTKRALADTATLRTAFDSNVRTSFMKYLGSDPDRIAELKQAGFTEDQIAAMKNYGKVPSGWNVHHKLPLDDGGTNDFSNLTLIENEPYHKVITAAQKALTGGLSPGQSKTIDFPIPSGYVYPAIPQ